jgi:hypothetical protein
MQHDQSRECVRTRKARNTTLSGDIFGIDEPLTQVVEYFKAAAMKPM